MKNVKVTRKVISKPPIERIEFESIYGSKCKIRKRDSKDDFELSIDDTLVFIDRETLKEVVEYLSEMVNTQTKE